VKQLHMRGVQGGRAKESRKQTKWKREKDATTDMFEGEKKELDHREVSAFEKSSSSYNQKRCKERSAPTGQKQRVEGGAGGIAKVRALRLQRPSQKESKKI